MLLNTLRSMRRHSMLFILQVMKGYASRRVNSTHKTAQTRGDVLSAAAGVR